ncbi:MAG: ABC transporter substrate-binding protein [Spirochaetales bacterium]|nr:ABC transporter substrate-binding protein [Spirochaetales bacterium]
MFFALALCTALRAEKRLLLVLSGPPAAVSFPLAYMVARGSLADLAQRVEFRTWMTPDQLRSMALGKEADFMAMPSNVAANLYNRGAPVRLVNISTWGILYLVSRGKPRTTLADFKGEEIAMPFRGDMPDIVFQLLAEKQNLKSQDFTLRYVASPLDAMQLLLMRRVDHALLAEPAISMALRRSGSFPLKLVAPELSRSLSLQKEWGRLYARAQEMPQAGIVAVGEAGTNRQLIAEMHRRYSVALKECQKDPDACSRTVQPFLSRLMPEAIADSIRISPLRSVAAADAATELKFFLGQLHAREAALLGGKMPAESFYRWP